MAVVDKSVPPTASSETIKPVPASSSVKISVSDVKDHDSSKGKAPSSPITAKRPSSLNSDSSTKPNGDDEAEVRPYFDEQFLC